MSVKVNEDNFDVEVLKANLPVLLEFYTDSCIPCKQMSPILADLEEEFENQIKIVKVNANFNQSLSEKYKVMASPTILLFKDGQEIDRMVGLKKKAELEKIIQELL